MSIPQIPIVNATYPGLYGFYLGYVNTTTLGLSSGRARNSTNVNDITMQNNSVINTAVSAQINGLDTGTFAASSKYYVYAVGDSTQYNLPGGLISLSITSPQLPAGYDMFRRVGMIITDGSAHIYKFFQTGDGIERTMWYDVGIQAIDTTSATYVTADITNYMPALITNAIFDALVTPTAAGNIASVKPTVSAASGGYATLSGSVAGVTQEAQLMCPVSVLNDVVSVDVKVIGHIVLNLRAYVDQLIGN